MIEKDKRKAKKSTIIIRIILGLVALFILLGLDHRLKITEYVIDSDKIDAPVRIALITDLHSCYYGKDMHVVTDKLDETNPDVVLLGGDIFDDVLKDDNTEIFLSKISNKYPCYYVTGNHECWATLEDFQTKMEILDRLGIPVLKGDVVPLEINGQKLMLAGVDDPDICLLGLKDDAPNNFDVELNMIKKTLLDESETEEEKPYTILLSHRPEAYEKYQGKGIDLVLSGHAHGGQWRIPLLVNGLYAPNQGIFPKYAGGLYDNMDTTMINSRGLCREAIKAPRLYNPPELVIIDLE